MASLVTNASRIAAAKEKIKKSIINKGIEVSDELKIDNYSSKIDYMINISNEPQMCYMFKNGRFLNQFDNIIEQNNAVVLDCTGMFHNICLSDDTYRVYDFQKLNLSECTNFYDCFTGGADWWTIRGKVINFDMSKVDNCSYMFNNCTYLTGLTFKKGASFGGNSSNSSLTLDLSHTGLTIEALNEFLTSISENINGNTRIIKLSSVLYESLTEDLLLLAIEKGYELSA